MQNDFRFASSRVGKEAEKAQGRDSRRRCFPPGAKNEGSVRWVDRAKLIQRQQPNSLLRSSNSWSPPPRRIMRSSRRVIQHCLGVRRSHPSIRVRWRGRTKFLLLRQQRETSLAAQEQDRNF